jgi:cephalosporin-C deacetylase-like acetyl esterase
MQSFDQWWEENKESLEKTIGTSGKPVFSRREIAHAAWAFSTLSFSQTINQAVEDCLREAAHEA